MNPGNRLKIVTEMPSSNGMKFDDCAFEILFKKYFTPLCAYCQYKFSFDLDVAKETVHSGFIKLWENRQTITSESTVKAYLYKIITNIGLDLLKHEKVREKHEEHVIRTAPITTNNDFDSPDVKKVRDAIDKSVSELPEQMRRIFELRWYEGLKYSEIANHLSISVKTVETQMSRALVRLRQKLVQYSTFCLVLILLGK